jgi:hypothetical protein
MQKHDLVSTENTTVAMQDAALTNPESIFPGDNPKHFTHPRANGSVYIGGVRVDYELRRNKKRDNKFTFTAHEDGLTITAAIDVVPATMEKIMQGEIWILEKLRESRIHLKELIEASKHPDYCRAFKHTNANAYVDILGIRVEYKINPSNNRKIGVALESDGLVVNAPNRMSLAEINANMQIETGVIFNFIDVAVDRIKANAKWETALRDLPNAPRFTHPRASGHAQIGDSLVDYQLCRLDRKAKVEFLIDLHGLTVIAPLWMKETSIQKLLEENHEKMLAGLKKSVLLRDKNNMAQQTR